MIHIVLLKRKRWSVRTPTTAEDGTQIFMISMIIMIALQAHKLVS